MGLLDWLFRRSSASPLGEAGDAAPPRPSPDPGLEEDDGAEPDAVVFEITDVLDLHSFAPKEVKDVVRDYLDEAVERGFRSVRIIHGRGVGVQRRTVHAILGRDARVASFGDAPMEAGGWGATLVEFHAPTDRVPDPPPPGDPR